MIDHPSYKSNMVSPIKLDAAKSHDIRELMSVLQANGVDNYTYAVCEIAVDAELSADTQEGLTEAEYKRLVAKYQDAGAAFGWRRDLAVADALEAARAE